MVKDNLFEMLLSLFEKTLTQLKETHLANESNKQADSTQADTAPVYNTDLIYVKSANPIATRVYTDDEQLKLTKASYQFLMRIASWGILDQDMHEVIMNQLIFSDSPYVSLQETKWSIRHTMAKRLDAQQLAFLDLCLYHKEDGLTLH